MPKPPAAPRESVSLRDYVEQCREDLETMVEFRLNALHTLLEQDRLAAQARLADRLLSLEGKLDTFCVSHLREHDTDRLERARVAAGLESRMAEIAALRESAARDRSVFATRDQLDAITVTLRERMDAGLVLQNPQPALEQLRNRLEQTEQARSNIEGRFWMLGAALSGLVVIINIALAILLKGWHG